MAGDMVSHHDSVTYLKAVDISSQALHLAGDFMS
jgi:hypothetical protein